MADSQIHQEVALPGLTTLSRISSAGEGCKTLDGFPSVSHSIDMERRRDAQLAFVCLPQ